MVDYFDTGHWSTIHTILIILGTVLLVSKQSASTSLIGLLLSLSLIGLRSRLCKLRSVLDE